MATLSSSGWRWLAPGVIAVFGGGPSQAAIFGGDDRISFSPRSGSLYAPIGRLIGDGRTGTGFLVGDCHVLTAEHNYSSRPAKLGEAVVFQAVHARFGRAAPASRGTIVASGRDAVEPRAGDWTEGRSRDWMLVRLDQCLGKRLGVVDLHAGLSFRFDGADARSARPAFPATGDPPMPSCSTRRAASAPAIIENGCTIALPCPAIPAARFFQEVRVGGRIRLRVIAMVTSGEHGAQPRFYDHAAANRATKMAYILPRIAPFLAPAPAAR